MGLGRRRRRLLSGRRGEKEVKGFSLETGGGRRGGKSETTASLGWAKERRGKGDLDYWL